MSDYQLTWLTDQLAVGYAPMSYAELDKIKEHGIGAIVNLCGEFCDLHEIEKKSGFEVFFLPIPDESAPDMAEMEKGLQWLDEAIYLGKKVLVHCRHGIGRTGTFVTAYLLRRGMSMKLAEKRLKGSRANPTNFSQWWLLRKYGKKSGKLTIREPSLEHRQVVDLSDFFSEYEGLAKEIDHQLAALPEASPRCGLGSNSGCGRYFDLHLIEALYMSKKININLTSQQRQQAIERAVIVGREIRTIVSSTEATSKEDLAALYLGKHLRCPLLENDRCLLSEHRPISCRLYGQPGKIGQLQQIDDVLAATSRSVFLALAGIFPPETPFLVSCTDTVSGRFAQVYFHYLAAMENQQ